MATVTENLDLPDGTTPDGAIVVIQLVGTNSRPVLGYVDGATIVGKVRPDIDEDGIYTVELPANGDILPSGTRWMRTLAGVGITNRDVDYWNIETDGVFDAFDVLSEAPGAIATAALDALAVRVAALEATAEITVTYDPPEAS